MLRESKILTRVPTETESSELTLIFLARHSPHPWLTILEEDMVTLPILLRLASMLTCSGWHS